MNIAVLAGGTSNEREVSLRSGNAVSKALLSLGYGVKIIDPAESGWRNQMEDIALVFPVLHGAGGEDGEIQAALDTLGMPYVGCGAEASQLCFDKWDYRNFVAKIGVPLAHGEMVHVDSFWKSKLITRPFVLKPRMGGSSLDTLIVRQIEHIENLRINTLLGAYGEMLLEELIEGIEITAAVLGDNALPLVEIIPPASGEFDYENKYNGASQELCPPQHIDETAQAKARTLAEKIHAASGCTDYSRTDMIIRPDGEPVVLETNTLPGMTEQSLFPKAAAASGLSMAALCDRLVELALGRSKS